LALVGPLDARQTNPDTSPADARILGIVVDEAANPVSGALVLLSDGRSTETGSDGRFSFVRVRPGTHEIAAVTRGCAMASGGFDVRSGRDALLKLIVEKPSTAAQGEDRSRGTPTRSLDEAALLEFGDRTALEALESVAGHLFQVSGSRLAIRSRAGSNPRNVVEPLLVLDGVRMNGFVADALRGVRASDLSAMEIHVGNVAGWEFQNGGAPAVIELTMRRGRAVDPLENPEICVRPKGS
jgi:hypothetical protein